MAHDSSALAPCAPVLFVSITSAGSQSSGSRPSMPAPVVWIQRSRGARSRSRSFGGLELIMTSAVFSASPRMSPSQPKVTLSRFASARCRRAAACQRSSVR
ncbi:hypothetical protein D3C83_05170 [compost metagenome]